MLMGISGMTVKKRIAYEGALTEFKELSLQSLL